MGIKVNRDRRVRGLRLLSRAAMRRPTTSVAILFCSATFAPRVDADKSVVPPLIRSGDALFTDFLNDLLGHLAIDMKGRCNYGISR